MAEPFVGEIKLVGFTFAPVGWAFCAGQLLPIAQNIALFSLLGTIYGGDGRVTFALPDLRGRRAIHFGPGPGLSDYDQGQAAGQERVTLLSNEMPGHTHPVNAVRGAMTGPNANVPTNAAWSNEVLGNPQNLPYSTAAADTTMSPTAIANTGGNQPHENRSPYLVLNYIIALEGIFPARP